MPTEFESVPIWLTVVGFLLLLGPLVTLHELGHYLVARWCGVKAEVFSVGFGKELVGRTDRHGTRWRLSLLPLGGYVQFKGDMSPSSQPSEEYLALPEHERRQCFQSAKLGHKALIVAAGPVTNILIAIAIFAAFFMAYGKPVAADPAQENYVAAFAENSAAQDAGIRVGDRIVELDGERLASFTELQQAVFLYPNRTFAVTVERGGDELTIPVTTRAQELTDRFGNKTTIGLLGVQTRPTERRFERVGPIEATGLALVQCVEATKMMVTGIVQIFSGDRSVKELGGPITMAQLSGQQLSLGWPEFTSFLAFISLNLAFINLLPIPVLDGGHLAFYAAEAVRRKPASPRSQELAFRTGLALVLGLMLFVTIVDIAKLPFFGG
nr:RIP metalloprotease RseP [Alteraurantiacibacter buctensis]